MSVSNNLLKIKSTLPEHVTLVAVSKTYPSEIILEAYQAGQRIFGENKVQELIEKKELLPQDIEWHLIGHLQTNKIKYIINFVSLIHAVDSEKLLLAIEKEAAKNNRIVNCLLQIYIAQEESKFGLDEKELHQILKSLQHFKHVQISGLMGMATNTDNQSQIRNEFLRLNQIFQQIKQEYFPNNTGFKYLSMGMSGDYQIAIECGSNMIRVGSSIFGNRQ